MRHLFWGGVHPAGRKELSRGAAPTPAPLPSQVVIPMVQHIGKPCTPLVKAGEPVKLGQKIGDEAEDERVEVGRVGTAHDRQHEHERHDEARYHREDRQDGSEDHLNHDGDDREDQGKHPITHSCHLVSLRVGRIRRGAG